MTKTKRFGSAYKPTNLGAEPAAPGTDPAIQPAPPQPAPALAEPESPAPVPSPATVVAMDVTPPVPAIPLAPEGRRQPAKGEPPRRIVPFSSRISLAADDQLKALNQKGHTNVKLLAEALNLLFKKYGLDQSA